MVQTMELLNKHYKQLRDLVETTWNAQNNIQLTSSEWYILNCIHSGASTAPDILKKVEISKQAVHKFLTNLEEKKLIHTELVKTPKLQKKVELTAMGIEVYQQSLQIKQQIDQQIAENIGHDNFNQLQTILQMKWI